MRECRIFRVGRGTRVGRLADALVTVLSGGCSVDLQCIGPKASFVAARAMALAAVRLSLRGLDLQAAPSFVKVADSDVLVWSVAVPRQ